MNVCNIRAFDSSDNQYILDVKGKQSFPTTFELANITELKNSKGGFNKSIDLPATKKNIEYFGAYWDVNEEGDFNPKQKHRAILEYDTVKVLDGFIQLVEVRVENGRYAEYNVRLFSESVDLFNEFENKLLSSLDLSMFDHEVTLSNVKTGIEGGFTAAGGGDVHYGIQDYGRQITNEIWGAVEDRLYFFECKPYLNLKNIFDKMMSESGFTYESDFLQVDNYFSSLFLLAHNRGLFISFDTKDFYLCKAGISSDESIASGGSFTNLAFDDESSFDFQDSNGVNLPNEGIGSGSAWFNPEDISQGGPFKLRLKLGIVNTDTADRDILITLWRRPEGGTNTQYLNLGLTTISIGSNVITEEVEIFESGFYFFRVSVPNQPSYISGLDIIAGGNTFFECYESQQVSTNLLPTSATLNFDASLNVPQEMTQGDILKFMDSRFNLVFVPDKNKKNHYKIEPYMDYIGGGSEKDWSKKLDVSNTYTIKPLSSIEKRVIEYKTKEGKDILNKIVKDNAGRIYGRQKFINDTNQFATGSLIIESPDTVTYRG